MAAFLFYHIGSGFSVRNGQSHPIKRARTLRLYAVSEACALLHSMVMGTALSAHLATLFGMRGVRILRHSVRLVYREVMYIYLYFPSQTQTLIPMKCRRGATAFQPIETWCQRGIFLRGGINTKTCKWLQQSMKSSSRSRASYVHAIDWTHRCICLD